MLAIVKLLSSCNSPSIFASISTTDGWRILWLEHLSVFVMYQTRCTILSWHSVHHITENFIYLSVNNYGQNFCLIWKKNKTLNTTLCEILHFFTHIKVSYLRSNRPLPLAVCVRLENQNEKVSYISAADVILCVVDQNVCVSPIANPWCWRHIRMEMCVYYQLCV